MEHTFYYENNTKTELLKWPASYRQNTYCTFLYLRDKISNKIRNPNNFLPY